MPKSKVDEAQILLAIQDIQSCKIKSIREAVKVYGVKKSTLIDRMNETTCRGDCHPNSSILSELEEQVLENYLLDKDDRGYGFKLTNVEDMANHLLNSRGAPSAGSKWAQRFIQRKSTLRMRQSRAYDFQRALCEDPDAINAWFRLVENTKAKYGIADCDIYNFDETGFMMGQIQPRLIVTRADRPGRSKAIQPGNKEWATSIHCINSEGWHLPPFILLKGNVIDRVAKQTGKRNTPPSPHHL